MRQAKFLELKILRLKNFHGYKITRGKKLFYNLKFQSVRPQESGIETSPIIQRSRATQLKMADFSTEMDMDEKSDKESAKSNDSDFSDFDDDDFDVSLLETSISKMATQPKSPVIEAHDEWATPPDKKFGTLEYPLTDKQMEEYLRIKRLKDLYQVV